MKEEIANSNLQIVAGNVCDEKVRGKAIDLAVDGGYLALSPETTYALDLQRG